MARRGGRNTLEVSVDAKMSVCPVRYPTSRGCNASVLHGVIRLVVKGELHGLSVAAKHSSAIARVGHYHLRLCDDAHVCRRPGRRAAGRRGLFPVCPPSSTLSCRSLVLHLFA